MMTNSIVVFKKFHPCNFIFYSAPTPSLLLHTLYLSPPPPPPLLQHLGKYKLPAVNLATTFLNPAGESNTCNHACKQVSGSSDADSINTNEQNLYSLFIS